MNSDWIRLLESLVARKVEFLVVGAWAMAYHGQPRYTGELGGVTVRFLSRRAFVKNKLGAARPKDLLDAQILTLENEP